jgi:hypothetical protein
MTNIKLINNTLLNIREALEQIDDGSTGYVLHSNDFSEFLCEDDNRSLRLGSPLSPRVAVFTSMIEASQAKVRFGKPLAMTLRREAMTSYIGWLQRLLHATLKEQEHA